MRTKSFSKNDKLGNNAGLIRTHIKRFLIANGDDFARNEVTQAGVAPFAERGLHRLHGRKPAKIASRAVA